jgi:hypothetical protein
MTWRNPRLWLPDDWDETRLDTSERSYAAGKRNVAIAALRLPADPTEKAKLAEELLDVLGEGIGEICIEVFNVLNQKKGRSK